MRVVSIWGTKRRNNKMNGGDMCGYRRRGGTNLWSCKVERATKGRETGERVVEVR
jgi:hypothetical protein